MKLSFLQLLIFYMSVQSDGTDTKTTHRHTQIAKKTNRKQGCIADTCFTALFVLVVQDHGKLPAARYWQYPKKMNSLALAC